MRLFFFLFFAFAVFACNNNQSSTTETVAETDSLANTDIDNVVLNTNYDVTKLKGIYSGLFDGTPISISVNYVSGKNVSGYNVHKGLKRNIRGTLEPMGSQFKLMLDEPGSNKYDGHFELFVDTASYKGQGTWTPKNDPDLKKKTFTFARQKNVEYNDLAATWGDSLNRTMELKVDGAAVFSYYTNKGTPQEQLESFGGNWQQKQDSVFVYWQPNTVFPSRRSGFRIMYEKVEGDTAKYLNGLHGEKVDWFNAAP
jgi:hypothetical protein